MVTYAMTINETSDQGKALLNYLGTLNVGLRPITLELTQDPCQFSVDEMRAILAQSAEEARTIGGTAHADFKNEVASWL